MLSVTPGAFESERADGPARTGLFGVALRCSVLMSYVRVSTPGWIRTSALCPRKAVLESAELRAYAVKQSLRQESNPHLIRTKGACLPLTLRRPELHGDGGSRTHSSSVQARCSSGRTSSPRSERRRPPLGDRAIALSRRISRAMGRTSASMKRWPAASAAATRCRPSRTTNSSPWRASRTGGASRPCSSHAR